SADLRLDFAATDARAGEYRLTVSAPGSATSPMGTRTIRIEEGQRTDAIVPLEASTPGTALVGILLEGEDGLRLEQVHEVPVRPASAPVARRIEVPLAADGGSLRLDGAVL